MRNVRWHFAATGLRVDAAGGGGEILLGGAEPQPLARIDRGRSLPPPPALNMAALGASHFPAIAANALPVRDRSVQ